LPSPAGSSIAPVAPPDAELQQRVLALEGENRRLERLEAELQGKLREQQAMAQAEAPQTVDLDAFKRRSFAFRQYIALLRSVAGAGAKKEWTNFRVRRSMIVPAFSLDHKGALVEIKGDAILVSSHSNVKQLRRRTAVDWGARRPADVATARVLSVEPHTDENGIDVGARIGGLVELRDEKTSELMPLLANPVAGLVTDVIGHMSFGSSGKGFSRQDFFKPTIVAYEGEGGQDEGGLTAEMCDGEHLPCTFPVPSLYLPCTFPVPSLYLPGTGTSSLPSHVPRPTPRRW